MSVKSVILYLKSLLIYYEKIQQPQLSLDGPCGARLLWSSPCCDSCCHRMPEDAAKHGGQILVRPSEPLSPIFSEGRYDCIRQ